MSQKYAAEIVDGIIVRVLVGDQQWCTENLGGLWVGTDSLVGIGWTWDEINGFQTPTVEP